MLYYALCGFEISRVRTEPSGSTGFPLLTLYMLVQPVSRGNKKRQHLVNLTVQLSPESIQQTRHRAFGVAYGGTVTQPVEN